MDQLRVQKGLPSSRSTATTKGEEQKGVGAMSTRRGTGRRTRRDSKKYRRKAEMLKAQIQQTAKKIKVASTSPTKSQLTARTTRTFAHQSKYPQSSKLNVDGSLKSVGATHRSTRSYSKPPLPKTRIRTGREMYAKPRTNLLPSSRSFSRTGELVVSRPRKVYGRN